MKFNPNNNRYFDPKIVKFLGVGLINTLVGYSIYAILITAKLPYSASLFISTIAGVTFNYFSIGRLVFSSKGGIAVCGKFFTAYGVVYFSNIIGLELSVSHLKLNPYLGQAMCVPPIALISWLLMNYWVFKK